MYPGAGHSDQTGVYGVPRGASSTGPARRSAGSGCPGQPAGMAVVTLALIVLSALPGLSPPPPTASWTPPVLPLVVEQPFRPSPTPWGRGHRGVDLAAPLGSLVRAPADGLVRYAGVLAGRPVMSIEHEQPLWGRAGWRTTYEAVRPLVAAGTRVHRGEVVGRVAAGGHCACLHWGIRHGTSYADPLALLSRGIVLKPLLTLPRWSGARVGLLEGGAQAFHGDVRVDLGRREAGMPEDLLHRAEVGAALEHMRGRAVP